MEDIIITPSIGRYYGKLVRDRLTENQRPTQDYSSQVEALLTNIHQQAGPLDWMVCGGLGLALHARRFYRTHEDLDLAVKTRDLAPFVERMKEQGYLCVSRIAAIKLSPHYRVFILRKIEEKELEEELPKRIKLIKTENGKMLPNNALGNQIDLFPFHIEQGLLHVRGFGAYKEEKARDTYQLSSGLVIPIESCAVIKEIKSVRTDKKTLLDLKETGDLLRAEI